MHSIVTTFRRADIKVEVAKFCAAMDTMIDQDVFSYASIIFGKFYFRIPRSLAKSRSRVLVKIKHSTVLVELVQVAK